MDLTFSFCSARALLANLLALDKKGIGVSIAFIIFTAQDCAKVTDADYNTAVLEHLLGLFKKGIGKIDKGKDFYINIGNTLQ